MDDADLNKLADNFDFAVLDMQTKVTFGAVEWYKKQKLEAKKYIETAKREFQVLRTQNPLLFDQLLIVVLAASIEIASSYLKRRS